MPILPEVEERPSRVDQLRDVFGRVGRVVTGPAPVTVRLVVLMVFAVVGGSMAPVPWGQIAVLAVVGIVLETVSIRRATRV